MTNCGVGYTETGDLYLQMLSEARRMEDRRLAKLLIRRIMDHQQATAADQPMFDKVVPLPRAAGGAIAMAMDPEIPFWSQGRFWQELLQFLVIMSVGMGWLLYFFYLVVQV